MMRVPTTDVWVATVCAATLVVAPVAGQADRPLRAPETKVVVSGTLVDSAVNPLPYLVIQLEGTERVQTRSSQFGDFRLPAVSPGTYILRVEQSGFQPQHYQVVVDEGHVPELRVGAIIVESVPAKVIALTGTVRDSATGEPVVAVGVTVNGRVAAVTDEQGQFIVTGVPRGRTMLEIRRIGYEPVIARLTVPEDREQLDLDVTMTRLPVQLAEIMVVDDDRTVVAFGRIADFYRRRETGLGHFVTRWDIERRSPTVASDLVRNVPGVLVVPNGFNLGNTIRLMGLNASCGAPIVFLDGARLFGADIDNLIPPDHIEAMEIYTRPAQIPTEFNTQGAGCGVIAIWTR